MLQGVGLLDIADGPSCLLHRAGDAGIALGARARGPLHVLAFADLALEFRVERSKEAAIHALLLDPLCAACCSPREIQDMTREMFDAEAEFLPGYK